MHFLVLREASEPASLGPHTRVMRPVGEPRVLGPEQGFSAKTHRLRRSPSEFRCFGTSKPSLGSRCHADSDKIIRKWPKEGSRARSVFGWNEAGPGQVWVRSALPKHLARASETLLGVPSWTEPSFV